MRCLRPTDQYSVFAFDGNHDRKAVEEPICISALVGVIADAAFFGFFEKYQICVFLLVLYVYRLCRKERGAEPYLIAAVGTMPTSVFLFADELLIKENIFQKLLRIGRTFAVGVMFLVCTGRIHLLVPRILLDEVSSMAQRFGLKSLSIRECLNSFTNLVHGAFLGISSENSAGKYIWTDVLGKISLLGVIIFVFMVLGVIVSRKEHFTRLCAVWTVSAFVLFVGFQWSVHASPLFSIYFAWAFIPLFQKGLQFVIEKLHLKEKAVYTVLITAIFAGVLGMMGAALAISIHERKMVYALTFAIWFIPILFKNSSMHIFQPFMEYDFNVIVPMAIWCIVLYILVIITAIIWEKKIVEV
mgnify:CR=1 FL=1